MQLSKQILMLCGLLFLAGCHEQPADYAYLMSHPATLQKSYERCKANDFRNTDCDAVQRAEHDFGELVNERARDPLGFGRQVLEAQMQLAKSASPAQRQMVDTLLAVISVSSPE